MPSCGAALWLRAFVASLSKRLAVRELAPVREAAAKEASRMLADTSRCFGAFAVSACSFVTPVIRHTREPSSLRAPRVSERRPRSDPNLKGREG